MNKNILILTGSSRKGGNSDLMADAFAKGAEAAGHVVTKICVAELNIGGCTVCDGCYSKGQACVQNDDFNQLATKIETADAVVFSTPLYWFTFPAKLKAAIDKFYSFLIAEKKLAVKESLLLVCAEMEDSDVFHGIINTYAQSVAYLNWEDRGCYYVPGVCDVGDIVSTGSLDQIEAMGKKF